MREGEIVAQAAGRLEAEDGLQLQAIRCRPTQIGGLRRRHGKAPVIDGQILLQEPIRLVQGRDPGQPRLLISRS